MSHFPVRGIRGTRPGLSALLPFDVVERLPRLLAAVAAVCLGWAAHIDGKPAVEVAWAAGVPVIGAALAVLAETLFGEMAKARGWSSRTYLEACALAYAAILVSDLANLRIMEPDTVGIILALHLATMLCDAAADTLIAYIKAFRAEPRLNNHTPLTRRAHHGANHRYCRQFMAQPEMALLVQLTGERVEGHRPPPHPALLTKRPETVRGPPRELCRWWQISRDAKSVPVCFSGLLLPASPPGLRRLTLAGGER